MKLPENARIAIWNVKLETDMVTQKTCINIEYRIMSDVVNELTGKTQERPIFWGTLIFPIDLDFLVVGANIKLEQDEFNAIDKSWDNLYELKMIAEEIIKIILKPDLKIYKNLSKDS
jgi:hypothetical protein